jgi:hypothetical protein
MAIGKCFVCYVKIDGDAVFCPTHAAAYHAGMVRARRLDVVKIAAAKIEHAEEFAKRSRKPVKP